MGLDFNFWKNKRVLITGHTGFKGSWLSLWLKKLGSQVTGFSISIPTEPSLYKDANVESGMKNFQDDIRDYEKIHNVIYQSQPEIIFHLAAQSLVRKSYDNPLHTYSTNVMGTANLLESVKDSEKTRVVVVVTSDKCYENKDEQKKFLESDPMGGHDPYSSSKGCAELVTSAYRNSFFNSSKDYPIAIASVRAGNVIGGGDWSEDRLIPDIMRSYCNDLTPEIRNPDSIRPWQFVLDPLYGYLLLAQKMWHDPNQFSEAWNFGPIDNNFKPVSWFVQQFETLLKTKNFSKDMKNDQKYEAKVLLLDSSKAQQRLGWKPMLSVEESVKWISEWYKNYKIKNNMEEITLKQLTEYEKILRKQK